MADAEILVETLPAVGHAQTVDDEVVRPDSHAQTGGEADAGDRVGRSCFLLRIDMQVDAHVLYLYVQE
jgi:hypothetical protein